MNRRQKLVQKQFLNNEEKIIEQLDDIYSQSLKDITDKVKNLEFKIGELQEKYDWLDDKDPQKAQIKSQIQSKIYQKQYQQQLQKQLDGILGQLRTNAYLTVSDYLDGCYTDGFIGTMYDLHGQGVPLVMPIDQESMVRAVQLDSKISKGLYTHLGQDVNKLKQRITSQVSRGISTGLSFQQVAQQLNGETRIRYNNAIRIARTEGHRIQTTAAMDAMHTAKDKGADVVKQWDATLDARTRESHATVDGEIRELDKPFSNGLDFPGDPSGGASEVINCRCAILQRARWALDDDELETLKERAKYYDLDKSNEFDDFKKKYLKASTQINRGLAAKISGDGVPLHDEPVLLKMIDASNKKEVLKTLLEYEKSAMFDDIETACIVTKNGKVYKCFGIKDRVFPDFDLGDELVDAMVSHNHPITESAFSFSQDDLEMFQKYNLGILRGCDEKYTYELTRDALQIDDLPEEWDNFENYQHALMVLKAKENNFGYRRWLNE